MIRKKNMTTGGVDSICQALEQLFHAFKKNTTEILKSTLDGQLCHCALCAPNRLHGHTLNCAPGSRRMAFPYLIVKSSTQTKCRSAESRSNTGQSLVSLLFLANISFKIHMSRSVSFFESATEDESFAFEACSACEFGDLSRFWLSWQFVRQSSASPLSARTSDLWLTWQQKESNISFQRAHCKACLNSIKQHSCHYSRTWIQYAAVDSYFSDTPPGPWTPPTDSVIGTGARRSP